VAEKKGCEEGRESAGLDGREIQSSPLTSPCPQALSSAANHAAQALCARRRPPRAQIRHSERVIQVPRRRLRKVSIMTGIRQRLKNVRTKTKSVKSLINTFVYKGFCRLIFFLTYLNLCPSFTLQKLQGPLQSPHHLPPQQPCTLRPPHRRTVGKTPRCQEHGTNSQTQARHHRKQHKSAFNKTSCCPVPACENAPFKPLRRCNTVLVPPPATHPHMPGAYILEPSFAVPSFPDIDDRHIPELVA
jgi:hypothetical protein